jgi:hypothetical protein
MFSMCFFNTFVIVVIILLFIVDVYGFLFFVILPWCWLGVFLAVNQAYVIPKS